MKCPTCPDVALVMADRSGVEIDYCPDCRGVWLDRGELDKIVQRSERPEPPLRRDVSPQPSVHHGSGRDWDDDWDGDGWDPEHRDPRRRRRSMLGDLFDF